MTFTVHINLYSVETFLVRLIRSYQREEQVLRLLVHTGVAVGSVRRMWASTRPGLNHSAKCIINVFVDSLSAISLLTAVVPRTSGHIEWLNLDLKTSRVYLI